MSPQTTTRPAPPPPIQDVQQSIDRLVPVLRQYTPEEIDSMCTRLEALLERRQVSPDIEQVGRV